MSVLNRNSRTINRTKTAKIDRSMYAPPTLTGLIILESGLITQSVRVNVSSAKMRKIPFGLNLGFRSLTHSIMIRASKMIRKISRTLRRMRAICDKTTPGYGRTIRRSPSASSTSSASGSMSTP